jgi:Xaa-Pro aminopeptidase
MSKTYNKDGPMLNMSEFAKRRKKVMQKIDSTGLVILVSAPTTYRNNDCEYPYRQQSDFYYLTGFEEPEAVAILAPKRKEGEYILFCRPKDRDKEIWEGIRAGQKNACKVFGADESFPMSQLEEKLPELLDGREKIHYSLGLNKSFDKLFLKAINKLRGKIRNGTQSPLALIDVESTLHEMRLIKTASELNLMRKAAEISAYAHIRAMQSCFPGMNEHQLEAEITYEFQRNGARYPAYSTIVGSGANSCILHYTRNNKIIQEKDLVLVDAGCEYQYYASDITRTFPASGRFSAEQKAIYEIVLAAQLAGIKAVRPGAAYSHYHETVVKVITQGLLDLKLLKGRLSDLIEKQAYFKFYMHKSGHWLGMDVHDVGRYKVSGQWRRLEPGMVLTVEPGIYISADSGAPKRWHNIGIRIEDDVLVTEKGCEVLSHKAPKKIEDIEALMA